ncbi:hypothetical protein MM239_14210 [Belliella sp. DSM 111904]|uniref:Uncharacterized protein n=1 Tax=Belliella filtrata TaxID=2923435 RepID=A0ABS9V2B2_9BACT|nr:hypothetical protein [Belliella filtrata]MCH7410557.1 hypothetical protein [Belliella filtrata]
MHRYIRVFYIVAAVYAYGILTDIGRLIRMRGRREVFYLSEPIESESKNETTL